MANCLLPVNNVVYRLIHRGTYFETKIGYPIHSNKLRNLSMKTSIASLGLRPHCHVVDRSNGIWNRGLKLVAC